MYNRTALSGPCRIGRAFYDELFITVRNVRSGTAVQRCTAGWLSVVLRAIMREYSTVYAGLVIFINNPTLYGRVYSRVPAPCTPGVYGGGVHGLCRFSLNVRKYHSVRQVSLSVLVGVPRVCTAGVLVGVRRDVRQNGR